MWSFLVACPLARTTARPLAVGCSTGFWLAKDSKRCNDQVVWAKTVGATLPCAGPYAVGRRHDVSSQFQIPEFVTPNQAGTWTPCNSPAPKNGATSPEHPFPRPTPDPEADHHAELQAVRQQVEAMQDVSAHLRSDRFFVLEAVRAHGTALKFVDAELRKDRGVVLEAVRSNGLALEFVAEELRGDREVVLEAVRETGWALQFATPLLREDPMLQAESAWRTGGY